MQIYRLMKEGAFKLGTEACREWAIGARKKSGAGTRKPLVGLLCRIDSRTPSTRKGRRSTVRANSRVMQELRRKVQRQIGDVYFPEGVLAEHDRRVALLPAQMLVAEAEGNPIDWDASPFDFERDRPTQTNLARELSARGVAQKGGKRFSRKRRSFVDVQLAANELSAGGIVTWKAIAARLGVDVATLYRWRSEGHLRGLAKIIQKDGYGTAVSSSAA